MNLCGRVVIQRIVVKTRSVSISWDKPSGTGLLGRRRPACRRRESALGSRVELREPVARMPREEHKWQKPRGKRTDAEHWGGPTRRSDEGWECGRSKGVGSSGCIRRSTGNRRKRVSTTKPFTISKQLGYAAFKAVKANAGAAGVDEQSIGDFEKALQDNLYKVWNRMASGSYFPPPVKAVIIPKKNGGERILGVPPVADRVAQMVVKMTFESAVEPVFLADSYGYRPGKSALEAVGVTRQRCWRYDWVLEFDSKGLFDNIAHALLLRAVHKHTQGKWVRLYIERWLKAPMQLADGTLVERTKGTPQVGRKTPFFRAYFCPARSMSGSRGRSQTIPGAATPMTGWCIVRPRRRRTHQGGVARPVYRVRLGTAFRQNPVFCMQGRKSERDVSEHAV